MLKEKPIKITQEVWDKMSPRVKIILFDNTEVIEKKDKGGDKQDADNKSH